MGKLKPCPFCGGKSERAVSVNLTWYDCLARCVSCGAEIRLRYVPYKWDKKPQGSAKRYISRMWNRRSNDE